MVFDCSLSIDFFLFRLIFLTLIFTNIDITDIAILLILRSETCGKSILGDQQKF